MLLIRGLTTILVALLPLLLAAGGALATAATPAPLACPAGQVTWLRGQAAPGQALLVHFAGRPSGGGSAGPDGRWAIPLTVRERAGVYPVVVVDRPDGAVRAAFTCAVDLPVGATSTPTPTPRPVAPLPSPRPTLTPSGAPPPRPTGPPGVSVTPPATAPPARPPAPPPEEPGPAAALQLVAIQPHDPQDAALFEYVLLEHAGTAPQELAGWRLVHQPTGAAYAFPALTLLPGELLLIWSGDGEDDPATGTLYWPTRTGRWAPGATAALHDASGRIVSTLVVSSPDLGEEEGPGHRQSVLRQAKHGRSTPDGTDQA